jgi:hypothetical protein
MRVLDEQLDCYRRIDELSRDQSDHVLAGRTDELLAVLAQRQSIVERVTSLNSEIEPFVGRWTELAQGLTEQTRSAIRGRLSDLDELVGAINRRDEEDRACLAERRGEVARELETMSRRRNAASAYAGSASSAPKYQDRRG